MIWFRLTGGDGALADGHEGSIRRLGCGRVDEAHRLGGGREMEDVAIGVELDQVIFLVEGQGEVAHGA